MPHPREPMPDGQEDDDAPFILPVVDDPGAELARRLARWGIVDPPG